MKESITNSTTAAKSTAAERAALYRRLSSHCCGELPPGLKLETLQDLFSAVVRQEWDILSDAETKAGRRASRELNRIAAASAIGYDRAAELLLTLLDDFSADKIAPTMDAVPEERLPALVAAFLARLSA